MQKSNAEILNHFYGLLLELNFHTPDEDVLPANNFADDPFIQKHLRQIRLKTAQYKAAAKKNLYHNLVVELRRLREVGMEELRKLVNPREELALQRLFRKFEELSDRDEATIAEDEEFLQLISALKEKLDKRDDD